MSIIIITGAIHMPRVVTNEGTRDIVFKGKGLKEELISQGRVTCAGLDRQKLGQGTCWAHRNWAFCEQIFVCRNAIHGPAICQHKGTT